MAWRTTIIPARRTSGTFVRVPRVRGSVDVCTVPSSPPKRGDNDRPTEDGGGRGGQEARRGAILFLSGPREKTVTTTTTAPATDVAIPAKADATFAFVTKMTSGGGGRKTVACFCAGGGGGRTKVPRHCCAMVVVARPTIMPLDSWPSLACSQMTKMEAAQTDGRGSGGGVSDGRGNG
jgi:hypothetical protein